MIEGRFRFVINTRENRFEPPHVHVGGDNQNTCRINLLSGTFIESPPAGTCSDILAACRRNAQQIREIWEAIHGELRMSTVKVVNADRMMIVVTPGEYGINASFADGYSGTVPFRDIPEITDRSGLGAVELPNPYEIILTTSQDEKVELPWDFVRHYCDQTYRPRMELIAAEGRQVLATRVRALREAACLTQEALAQAAGIGRVTLVRLENGRHVPKLGTLRAIAQVLEHPVEDLIVGTDEPGEAE